MEHIRVSKVERVKMMDRQNPKNSPMGKLYVTTSHLIFIKDDNNQETWILHMLMNSIEKPVLTTSGSQLKISCANFRTVTFTIQRDRDAHDVYLSLTELSKPRDVKNLYCFSYKPNKGELRQDTGWNFHDFQAEFARQGVPNDQWECCTLNKDYELCPTYPKYLYVPKSASKDLIEGTARFRSRGRLPVLTYLHRASGAALVRCAQPMPGVNNARSQADERYVDCLRRTNQGDPSVIHVVDTRPAVNAMANKAGGKGYENDKFYSQICFSFRGIENIHKMRSSLKHLVNSVTTCNTSLELFRTELANSGWLKHVKAVLDVSLFIANTIHKERQSVIVHCSDGWDRTSQTCALAQLCLDGYYRTIHGFQALIEKDWLNFGHKFMDRCGHIQGKEDEVSPTFVQFLDCVWQLTEMFPTYFQFNQRYLVTIAEHVYSCQYGTFIGNCCKQRDELKLREDTYSLWGYLTVSVSQEDQFLNPLYNKSLESEVLPIQSGIVVPQNVRFWSGLYCQFETGAHPREAIHDLLSVTQNHTSSLEDHGRQLTKTIGYYTEKIGAAKMLQNLKASVTSGGAVTGGAGGGGVVPGTIDHHPLSPTNAPINPLSATQVDSSDVEPAVEAVTDERAYNHSAELVPELGMAAHRVNKNSQEDQLTPVSDVSPRRPVRRPPTPPLSHPLQDPTQPLQPTTAVRHPLQQASSTSSDFEQIERKFSNIKTSIVEKCQSSM